MAKNKTHQLRLTLIAVLLSFSFSISDASAVTLGISGNRFTLDGQAKFLVLVSYFDALDAQNLNADLDYFKSKGIGGIRILPNWWASGQGGNYSNTALFDGSGNIRTSQLNTLKNIITQANSRGMIVDISFTRETIQNLSISNYKDAIEAVIRDLLSYHNVFYDFQNEANCNNFTEQNASNLRQTIKNISSNIIISTSLACSISPSGTVSFTRNTVMDLVNHHEDRVSNWWNLTQSITQSLLSLGKPIYLGEPDRFRSGMTSDNFITAVSGAKRGGAAAWTFHTNAGFDLNGSRFQPKLDSIETDFLNRFQQVLAGITWGGGGGDPTGPQGICPNGKIELAGANASGADPTTTAGYFCDNDPTEATGVSYPVSGILKCDASGGTAFVTNETSRCQTWNFDANGPIGKSLLARVNCPGSISVTIQNGNITAGAWTQNPSTEGVVCITGTSVSPTPPAGPPTITGLNPATAIPGQQVEVYGTNLGSTVRLTSESNRTLDIGGSVDFQLAIATFEVPLDLPAGIYRITISTSQGSATSPQNLTIQIGGAPFPSQTTLPVPNQGLPTDLGQLIQQIFAWSLSILGISVFVMFFYSGFLWLTAAGNTAKISEARTHMTNAVLGAILLLSSYLILYTINPDFVKNTFNLPGLGISNTNQP